MPTRSRMPIKPWPTPGSAAGPRPSSTTSIVERGRRRSRARDARARGPGVLERVRQRLLDHAVRGEVGAGRELAGGARADHLDRQAGASARCRAADRAARARASVRSIRPGRRRSARRSSRRISARPARPVSSTWAIASCAAFGSRSTTVLAAPAWTIITLIAWATTSCSSRAMRVRSRVTASRAAVSRSSTKRRRRLKTIRPTRMGRPIGERQADHHLDPVAVLLRGELRCERTDDRERDAERRDPSPGLVRGDRVARERQRRVARPPVTDERKGDGRPAHDAEDRQGRPSPHRERRARDQDEHPRDGPVDAILRGHGGPDDRRDEGGEERVPARAGSPAAGAPTRSHSQEGR